MKRRSKIIKSNLFIIFFTWNKGFAARESWVIMTIAPKTAWCSKILWWYGVHGIVQFLNRSLTVSCQLRTLAAMNLIAGSGSANKPLGHLRYLGVLPRLHLSISTRSPGSKCVINPSLKIERSFHIPGAYGPLQQQMSPILMHRPPCIKDHSS